MNRIFIFWLLATVLSIPVYSQFQEGYLITADGDSLNGFVSFSEHVSLEEVAFKKEKRDNATKYKPDQVKAFGLSYTARVLSLNIPLRGATPRLIFIRQLVGGKMDLLVAKGQYFIRDGGQVYALLKDKNTAYATDSFRGYFKDVLERFFEGCISAENAQYEETSLRNLINNYNRCHRVQPVVFRDAPRGTSVSLSIFAGAEKSDMTVDEGAVIPTTFNPALGAGVTLYMSGLRERLFFDLQIHYGTRSGEAFQELPINSYRRIYSTYTIEFDMVRVPLGVGFFLTDPGRSPIYVKAGLSKGFELSSSFDYVRETESFSVVTTEAASHQDVVKGGIGFWGSLGIQTRIHGARKGFVEIRWEKSPASIEVPHHNFSFKMTNVGLYAGLLF